MHTSILAQKIPKKTHIRSENRPMVEQIDKQADKCIKEPEYEISVEKITLSQN